MEKVIQTMKEELIGKEFIYKSKYGGHIKSKITDISVTYKIIFDEETEKRLSKTISKNKISTPKKDVDNATKGCTYSAEKAEFSVVSENRNFYKLDEVYILRQKICQN
jgi:hypothetical protein